jgi:hypothetical protein
MLHAAVEIESVTPSNIAAVLADPARRTAWAGSIESFINFLFNRTLKLFPHRTLHRRLAHRSPRPLCHY